MTKTTANHRRKLMQAVKREARTASVDLQGVNMTRTQTGQLERLLVELWNFNLKQGSV